MKADELIKKTFSDALISVLGKASEKDKEEFVMGPFRDLQ